MSDRGDTADGERGSDSDGPPLLAVENLEKHYPVREGLFGGRGGTVRAVDGVSFSIEAGGALGLIGESGCGKSTLASTLLRFEEPTAGTVRLDGVPLGSLSDRELRRTRRRVSAVFQDATGSFDPRLTVGESVAEPLRVQGLADADRRATVVADLLERVRLDPSLAERYPHALSGGQTQRAALARALALDPDLLVLDEPVSALDVSVQAEIIELLRDLRADLGLALLCITHDTGVVRELCDRVCVMYLGELVERGPTDALFAEPRHPYTRALVEAVPDPDPRAPPPATTLRGEVADPADPPGGCRFHTRCPSVIPPEGLAVSSETYPALVDLRTAVGALAAAREADTEPDGPAAELATAAADARSGAALRSTLEETFGVPADPSGETVSAALETASERLASGDPAGALEALSPLASVCERTPPDERTVGDSRVACHLHEE